jgi:uncharacterized protein (TIGR02594 family)
MFADYKFNGYEITTNTGRKYPAVTLNFQAHVPDGTFTLTNPEGTFVSAPRVNATSMHSYNLVDKSSRSLAYPFCIRDTMSPAHRGILVDTALFRDEKLDGKTLTVSYSNPWMRTAMKEIGVKENPSKTKASPRILQYYEASDYSSQKSDDDDTSAWCACFVSWVLKQHNYPVSLHPMGALSYRAWNGATYGQTLVDPVYGAIAVKERKVKVTVAGKEKEVTRGHVGFVIGQSRDRNSLCVLGGNQGDKVCVAQSLRSAWSAFRMPLGFAYAGESLPVYIGQVENASREA